MGTPNLHWRPSNAGELPSTVRNDYTIPVETRDGDVPERRRVVERTGGSGVVGRTRPLVPGYVGHYASVAEGNRLDTLAGLVLFSTGPVRIFVLKPTLAPSLRSDSYSRCERPS